MFDIYTFVNSTAIALIGYNREACTLRVIFQSGYGWDYEQVPASAYVGLIQARSVGGYYGEHIRGQYESIKLDQGVVSRYLLDVIALERANAALD